MFGVYAFLYDGCAVLILPIGHDKAIYRMPVFTLGVIGVCVAVQLLRTIMHFAGMTGGVGELHPNDPIAWLAYYPKDGASIGLVTSQIAHGGYLHLIGNMVFLWLTGANMEYRWGARAWAGVFVLGGVVAAATFGILHPGVETPLVGASGSIAAAMGAFMVCLYSAKIRFWYFYIFFMRIRSGTFVAPAYVALPLWFLGELFNAYFLESSFGGVAYSAHVAGFAFGAGIALTLVVTGYEARLRAYVGSDVFDEDDEFIKEGTDVPPLPIEGRYADSPRSAQTDAASFMPAGPPLPVVSASEPQPAPQAAVPSQDSLPAAPSRAPSAKPPAAGDDWERFEQALERCDAHAVRVDGSRYLEAAARDRPGEVLPLFRRVATTFPQEIPLDDRSLAIAARFAAHSDAADMALAATKALIVQYPRSRHTPTAMWETAQLQRRCGWPDKAQNTLRNLAHSYPQSDAAALARRALAS